jgi:hypothetical protein
MVEIDTNITHTQKQLGELVAGVGKNNLDKMLEVFHDEGVNLPDVVRFLQGRGYRTQVEEGTVKGNLVLDVQTDGKMVSHKMGLRKVPFQVLYVHVPRTGDCIESLWLNTKNNRINESER